MRDVIIAIMLVISLTTTVSVIGGELPTTVAEQTQETQPTGANGTEYAGEGDGELPGTGTEPATATTVADGEPHYPLTDWERDLVERVVMAEAGGEEYDGQIAVAQCILNASELRHLRPSEALKELKYTSARPEATEQVKQAVAAVFDDGYKLLDCDVIYFYAPALVTSNWHESQTYVTTIGGHRFFKEAR